MLTLTSFWADAAFILLCLLALGLPIKWKKLVAGLNLMWTGFHIDVKVHSIGIDDNKVAYICLRLSALASSSTTSAHECASIGGLLMWLATTWVAMRPLLQPFYAYANGVKRKRAFRTPAALRCASVLLAKMIQAAPRRVLVTPRYTLIISAASDGSATPPSSTGGVGHASVGGGVLLRGRAH